MDIIDSDTKAYLLGWIASDGSVHPNGNIYVSVSTCDIGVLEALRDFICPDLPIADPSKGMKRLTVCSSQWYKAIKEHLNLSFDKGESHKKSHLVQMPVDIPYFLKWSFLRGLFEGDGSVFIVKSTTNKDYLRVSIGSTSLGMRMMIVTLCKALSINISSTSTQVILSGHYAARFLEKIYAGCDESMIFIKS